MDFGVRIPKRTLTSRSRIMSVGIPIFATSLFLLVGSIPATGPLAAQDDTPTVPPAEPADVESADAIIAAVYDVISGAAGQKRDWDRWRSLFIPEARIISVVRSEDGTNRHRVMTPEDYVQGAGPRLEENGFFEDEIGRTQEEYGPVVHLFSTYQSKRTADDPEPFMRGINSFQLFNDGNRWWVVTIFFTGEGPDLPIPNRYLGGERP
jgi:hypothetical protein